MEIVIIGGGAAGFFAAITAAEAGSRVLLLEQSSQFLSKVKISGGGRCNVTHDCYDPRQLASHYPRGSRALLSVFSRFQPRDMIDWLAHRGVLLKAEKDGRMFPVTDSSETIIQCLMQAAKAAGVVLRTRCGVERIRKTETGCFDLSLSNGEQICCEKVLLATGGCRSGSGGALAASLGHTIELPVPSLFTFHIDHPLIKALPGLTIRKVEVSVKNVDLRETGSLLMTHSGVSGPVILRLSAWGARILHQRDYRFVLQIDWLCEVSPEALQEWLQERRMVSPKRTIRNTPYSDLPSRLWEQLVHQAGIDSQQCWNQLRRHEEVALIAHLKGMEVEVKGKSLNKDEFVTCGGVSLKEIHMRTMESRICPNLYFAGELCDIDGITGGFNFQAAWSTGWLAGKAMANKKISN